MRLSFRAAIVRGGFRLDAAFEAECSALGVVGPSGSGKTTVVEAIAGVVPGAEVSVEDRDWTPLPVHARRVGYVPQDPLLFPHLTVRENLRFGSRGRGAEDAARKLSLEPLLDRMPRNLSGGEKRLVALGRALATSPRLLLLDEPFTGLDEAARRIAMSYVAEIRSEGVPMVLVSHRAEEVVGLTDRSVRLEAGRVVDVGETAAILRAGETRVDNYFRAAVVSNDRVRAGGIELTAILPDGAAGEVRLACYASDLILASEIPRGLSARNAFLGTVVSVAPLPGAVLVRLADPPLQALVTSTSAAALGLAAGAEVAVIVKATSLAYLGPA